jgi:5-methylcytosine-specific restriction endonuclease McrA
MIKNNYKGKKFCSLKCQQEYIKNDYIDKWKRGLVDGLKGNKIDLSCHVRNYLLKKVGYKCELCGWNTINKYTGLCPLHIHHKDGNAFNNKEENLQVLCPNCHVLTENYGSRNKVSCRRRSLYHTAKWRKELYNR